MKTVGEFKKAGLVFVGDDKLRSETNNHDSDEICMNRCWLGHGSYSGFLEVSDCYFANNEWVISSFAWRENTGVKPEFNGLVEWTGDSDFVYINRSDELIWSESSITKWRPSINQPSFVETDTKESAIHKAWVALKGDLSNAKQYDENGSYLAVCIKDGFFIKEGGYCLTDNLVENTEHWEDVCTVQEFTSYCEKMAAEEKRMDIIGQNGNDGLHYENTAQQVEVIINNNTPFSIELAEKGGFSYELKATGLDGKPIFTQAMADAGEKVKVGMEFSTATGNYVALLVNENTVVFEHEELGFVVENHIFIHPIDTRTDREKAIDDAMLKIGCHPSQDFIAGAPFIIGKLFDAELLNTKVS